MNFQQFINFRQGVIWKKETNDALIVILRLQEMFPYPPGHLPCTHEEGILRKEDSG